MATDTWSTSPEKKTALARPRGASTKKKKKSRVCGQRMGGDGANARRIMRIGYRVHASRHPPRSEGSRHMCLFIYFSRPCRSGHLMQKEKTRVRRIRRRRRRKKLKLKIRAGPLLPFPTVDDTETRSAKGDGEQGHGRRGGGRRRRCLCLSPSPSPSLSLFFFFFFFT